MRPWRASTKRIAAEVAANKWPDLAFGLVANGKLIWWRDYGEVDPVSHAPVTAETYFRTGSIAKVFTGLALLQLQEEGKLSLDDPLESFIPEVKGVIYPTNQRPSTSSSHHCGHAAAGVG
jgi:CubicO group peptidase (beta-lactamase class C family)